MKRRYIEKNNVLLVNITRLGDMLQATPTIAGIKAENPNCKITVLVEKQFESVCHWLPNRDEVISLDMSWIVRNIARGPEGTIDAYEFVSDFIDDLRKRNFDYCLNMSSSAYTALLLKMLNIKKHGGWTADDEGCRVIESDWAKLFACSVFHQNRRFNSINLVDVFRCSADVEKHPQKLLINIDDKEKKYCEDLLAGAGFTNTGPLVAVQAGASQGKRQWAPERFIKMIKILIEEHNMRVVLTGTKKELSIIQPIKDGLNSNNVFVAAGKTNIPQLTALLSLCSLLITGDTGPMHISIATGTPVLAMFLASAYIYETGPYSEGNIVLQPVVQCCPCNPNKLCSRMDCHVQISPELMADLAVRRVNNDFKSLPEGYANPNEVIVYRSEFDEFGFCDFRALTSDVSDPWRKYREAYRKVWLTDLAGYECGLQPESPEDIKAIEGLGTIISLAQEGVRLIDELIGYVKDVHSTAASLGRVNKALSELDRQIEQIGYHYQYFGPLTRMFIFSKENISGTDAIELASQMRVHYQSLERRGRQLAYFYSKI